MLLVQKLKKKPSEPIEAQVRMRGRKRSSPWSELQWLLCRSVRLAGAFIPFILPLASNQFVIQKGHVHTAGKSGVIGDRSACLLDQTTDFNESLKSVCQHLCQEVDSAGGVLLNFANKYRYIRKYLLNIYYVYHFVQVTRGSTDTG